MPSPLGSSYRAPCFGVRHQGVFGVSRRLLGVFTDAPCWKFPVVLPNRPSSVGATPALDPLAHYSAARYLSPATLHPLGQEKRYNETEL